jgi:predicted phage terminase large subunit-like protein
MGWREGEDFYVNHSGVCISLKENLPRNCEACGLLKKATQFYSALHKSCRTCQVRAREGVSIGSAKAIARDLDHHTPLAERRTKIQAPEKELAARILARRRLIQFIKRFQPGYMDGWVHHDICRRLERFVQAVADGKSPRLLLFCPPRLGKSLIASQFFPAWALGHHPHFEIIAASYGIQLPVGFSRRIRELLRDPTYMAMFGETRLSEESQAVESWRTTAGGGYTAAGVGTGITGKGAHILIVDDPVKDQEAADSAVIRESTWEWYLSTAYTRIAPGGGVLGIQTRWNDDGSGRIIMAMSNGDGEKFEIASYPAINEMGDEYILEDDSIVQLPPGDEPPEGARLTRVQNSALHPDRYDIDHLLRIKRNFVASGNNRMWAALYQQNPVPEEGAFFRKDMFRYTAGYPQLKGMHVYQAWDFSITEKETSDWIVGVCMLQDEYDNVYELDMVRFKSNEDAFIIADAMIAFHQKWDPWLVGVEDGQIWKSISAVVLRRAQEKHCTFNFEPLKPFTDKFVRAGPLRGRMQMGKMYFQQNAQFRETVDNELLRFPAGKHDDIVDAYAWCMRLVLAHQPPKQPKGKLPKSWKTKLLSSLKSGETHMAS